MTTPETQPELTLQEAVASVTTEAFRPDTSKDYVELPEGKRVQIRFMPIALEEKIIDLVSPFIGRVMQLNTEDPSEIASLLRDVMRCLPEAVAIISGLELDWIRANCSSMDLMPVAIAQLRKYGVQDLLGKPLSAFGLPSLGKQ